MSGWALAQLAEWYGIKAKQPELQQMPMWRQAEDVLQHLETGEEVVEVFENMHPVTLDCAEVAERLGLTPEAVSDLHQGAEFTVSFYGFAPGYAYLDGLPEGMRLDRKPVPKRGVPAGSVIIAGGQCLITTQTMPTGWWIIGRTPFAVLTGDPDHPFRLQTGDRLRFVPAPRSVLEADA